MSDETTRIRRVEVALEGEADEPEKGLKSRVVSLERWRERSEKEMDKATRRRWALWSGFVLAIGSAVANVLFG